jgi:hypothetical protein
MEVEGRPHEHLYRQEQAFKERHQEQDQREQNQPDPDLSESDSILVAQYIVREGNFLNEPKHVFIAF